MSKAQESIFSLVSVVTNELCSVKIFKINSDVVETYYHTKHEERTQIEGNGK